MLRCSVDQKSLKPETQNCTKYDTKIAQILFFFCSFNHQMCFFY